MEQFYTQSETRARINLPKFTVLPTFYMLIREKDLFSIKLAWHCQKLLSESLAKGHLARVSRLSAIDKGDEVIPTTVHRSGVYRAEEYSGKNSVISYFCNVPAFKMYSFFIRLKTWSTILPEELAIKIKIIASAVVPATSISFP